MQVTEAPPMSPVSNRMLSVTEVGGIEAAPARPSEGLRPSAMVPALGVLLGAWPRRRGRRRRGDVLYLLLGFPCSPGWRSGWYCLGQLAEARVDLLLGAPFVIPRHVCSILLDHPVSRRAIGLVIHPSPFGRVAWTRPLKRYLAAHDIAYAVSPAVVFHNA